MGLRNIVLKTEDIAGHVVSGVLGLDAIRNLYNGIVTGNDGYYQWAAVEGIGAVVIELSKHFRRGINDFYQRVPQLVERAQELDRVCSERFRKLYERLNHLDS